MSEESLYFFFGPCGGVSYSPPQKVPLGGTEKGMWPLPGRTERATSPWTSRGLICSRGVESWVADADYKRGSCQTHKTLTPQKVFPTLSWGRGGKGKSGQKEEPHKNEVKFVVEW